ncbi:ABC transporter permease [Vallitalea okinawensis]|uniref:ABC transporter permease n=1 Tax=Vallitalea okinawensis TaxID=2078660 RepID=UPI000CFD82F3|nr:ABC transporter permease subunit [Vallitalea okinawensis]
MLKIVIKKELRRVFTDKRLVFSVFLLPGLSLFVIYSMLGTFMNNLDNTFEEYPSTVLLHHAPSSFTEFMQDEDLDNHITFIYADLDENLMGLQNQIKDKKVDLVMVFDPTFKADVAQYQDRESPHIQTYYLSSNNYSTYTYNKVVNKILPAYEDYLLSFRFDNLSYLDAFEVNQRGEKVDLADEKEIAGRSLSFIFPMLIAIFLFASAMSVGTDMLAGEKERGTMATLLLSPIDRHTLALGKVLSLGIISLLGATSLFIGIIASMPFSNSFFMAGDVSYASLDFGPIQIIQLAILLLSMAALFVTLTCFLSIIAKTVKEANTYLTPCYMVVVLSAVLTTTNITTPPMWKFFIPIYGNILALQGFLTFTLTTTQLIAATSGCLLISTLLLLLITRKFHDERIIA